MASPAAGEVLVVGLFANARRQAAVQQFMELLTAAMREAGNVDADISSGNMRNVPQTAALAARAFGLCAVSAENGLRDARIVGWCNQMAVAATSYSAVALLGTPERMEAHYREFRNTIEDNLVRMQSYMRGM